MKKHKTKAERQYLNRVAEMGCIACKKLGFTGTPAEIHHIRNGVGLSQRSSHFDVIPLCPHHHRHGKDAIHQSKKLFEKRFGTEKDLLREVKIELS